MRQHPGQEKWLDSGWKTKYHCKVCGIHTTTADAARERAEKGTLADKLHLERVSQRGIARLTGLSRSTLIKRLKKSALNPSVQR
jgi:transcriptional regulator of acetoin/glycerol metabolism